MDKVERNSISLLRVFAMTLILLCHLVQEHSSIYVKMTAQVLNVGVTIFIIISGYLYGTKEIKEGYFSWVAKRAKRILIPMYTFMLYLLIINLTLGNNLKIENWIAYIFNLQGFEVYVHGAEHLWYLTIIMICYLITPILNKSKDKFNKNVLIGLILIGVLFQLLISYLVSTQIGIYLIHLYTYIFAYIIGSKSKKSVALKAMFLSIIAAIVSCMVRILGRGLFDDTILYNVIISGYTQSILGFSIFYMFRYIGLYINENKYINYIESISFEVYLVHYMYIVGPLRLMSISNNYILNSIVTISISVATAIILNNICKVIYRALNIRKQKIGVVSNL